MKKLLIDIYHLPQFNFFKNVILQYEPEEVDIYCVNRGKLLTVMQHELPGYTITCLGDYKHNNGMMSMAFKIILPRTYDLFKRIKRSQHRFVVTAHYQANFVARLKGIPNIAFIDDPRRFVFPLLKFSADEVYLPPFKKKFKGVKTFNALKEWSYLSPKYFKANPEVLKGYGLQPKEYIFIREVSTETSNYLNQNQAIILSLAHNFPEQIPVIISLEDKSLASKYPSNWQILQEPIEDFHSLLYYSKIVISSGDSMAREGAMLGVESIYAGIRNMPANEILIQTKKLHKLEKEEIISFVHNHYSSPNEEQDSFRKKLFNEWDDVTEMVLQKVRKN